MNLLWPVLILGGAAVYVLSSKSSGSASGGNQTPAQLAQANASFQAAQAFDAQAQALGLTQAQAQAAYDTGLTPQEYAQGVLGQSGGASATQTGLAGNPAVSSGAPLALDFYGEYEPQSGDPIYRDSETGQPILVDALGQFWTFAEAAALAA